MPQRRNANLFFGYIDQRDTNNKTCRKPHGNGAKLCKKAIRINAAKCLPIQVEIAATLNIYSNDSYLTCNTNSQGWIDPNGIFDLSAVWHDVLTPVPPHAPCHIMQPITS